MSREQEILASAMKTLERDSEMMHKDSSTMQTNAKAIKETVATVKETNATMRTNADNVKETNAYMKEMVASHKHTNVQMNIAEDDIQAVLYANAFAGTNLLNQFEETLPRATIPTASNGGDPPREAGKSAEAKKSYTEFNHCNDGLVMLKQAAENGGPLFTKDNVVELMAMIDGVCIGGTKKEQEILCREKRQHLINPLQSLIKQYNIDIDNIDDDDL